MGEQPGAEDPETPPGRAGHQNDRVELLSDHDSITIRKVSAPAHKTLEERLTAYYGKPLDQIEPVKTDGEIDWGGAKGDEVW